MSEEMENMKPENLQVEICIRIVLGLLFNS